MCSTGRVPAATETPADQHLLVERDGHTLVQLAGIGQTYTVSPNFLVDGTLGWTRFGQNVRSPDLGTNFGSDTLGIPGTNGPDPKESGMPAFNFGSD